MRAVASINFVKARRIARRLLPVAKREFVLDVWGRGRAFDAVMALAVSYIGLRTASFPKMIEEANEYVLFLQAFFYVAVAWAAWCLVRAGYCVVKEDQELGKWQGHHRIYYERQHVATERLTHNDGATQVIKLHFADVEPEAFVKLKFECDPKVEERMLLFIHGGNPRDDIQLYRPDPPNLFTGFFSPLSDVSIRISKAKTAALYVRIDPDTVPVVLRVFCSHFHVGKDDEKL